MPLTKSKLKKKLDKVFSEYVRLRNTDEWGYDNCITCESRKFWKTVDAGHFITRAKLSTRFDPRNVFFQCKQCNLSGGHSYKFGLKLDKMFGQGTAQEIFEKSEQRGDISTSEYVDLIDEYRKKVNELKAERNME